MGWSALPSKSPFITICESPSKSTSCRLSSLANWTARRHASALTSATVGGRGLRMDREPMISPLWSWITNLIPAELLLWKTAPSKLALNMAWGSGHQCWMMGVWIVTCSGSCAFRKSWRKFHAALVMFSSGWEGRLRRVVLRLFHNIQAIMMKYSALCSSATCKSLEIKLVKSPEGGWARSRTQLRFLHTPLTSAQLDSTCIISSGWTLHWLHNSEGTMCRRNKLSIVGRK